MLAEPAPRLSPSELASTTNVTCCSGILISSDELSNVWPNCQASADPRYSWRNHGNPNFGVAPAASIAGR